MRVVYSMTRNLYDKIYPSVASLLANNPDAELTIVCEDDELPAGTLPTDNYEIINVSGQKWFPETGANAKTPYSYMALLRVCYGEILKKYDKVLCLDVDTIVCDSLQPLWDIDLMGKWFAACREERGWYRPFGPIYYNIGVAVYNLEQLRRDSLQGEMVLFLNTVRTMCIEQDAFNLFGKDKFVQIPYRYNECFATGYSGDPAVVHFAGITDWWSNKRMARREYLDRFMPPSQK